ncbi:MAG: hypothetical protein V3W41_15325 [Planctomycetota bacterium]
MFANPLVVSVTTPGGAPLAGIPVSFVSQGSAVVVTGSNPAISDANGLASTTVTAGSSGAATTVVASTSNSSVSFNLSVTSFTADYTSAFDLLVLQAVTGISNLRMILAIDDPATTPALTQYGTFFTSILNPGPSLFFTSAYDDLPNYDPSIVTNQSGILTKFYFGAGVLNGTAVFQGYAVYVDGGGQLQVLVTNPAYETF